MTGVQTCALPIYLVGSAPGKTDLNGQAVVTFAFGACSSVGTQLASVTGTSGGSSAQAAATATCERAVVTFTEGDCVYDGPAPVLSKVDGHAFNCTFTAAPARVYDISYRLTKDVAKKKAFIADQDSTSDQDGHFTATVWSYGTGFTITAVVDSTVEYEGGSHSVHNAGTGA